MSKPVNQESAASTTTITDLNNDVLRDTFKCLSNSELNTVANVCYIFRWNAQAVFSKRYAHTSYRFHIDESQFCQLHSTLRNFGRLINSMVISFDIRIAEDLQKVVEVIVQYCGETLNELKLDQVTFDAKLISILKPLLARLGKIQLDDCRYNAASDAPTMFSLCSELHTLSLVWPFNSWLLYMPTCGAIPKLKTLEISGTGQMDCKSTETFLAANPQLKEIQIKGCKLKTRIFHSVARYTPQIEKFVFTNYSEKGDDIANAKVLGQLNALKWLEVDCQRNSFASFISEVALAEVSLACLSLSWFVANTELFDSISGLKRLKTLELVHGTNMQVCDVVRMVGHLSDLCDLRLRPDISVGHCLQIIRSAPKLQYLQLYKGILDVNSYSQIVEMVVKRKEMCRLEICLGYGLANVPHELLKANQNMLQIDNGLPQRPYTV